MKYFIINTESFQSGDVPEAVQEYLKRHPKPFIILDESSKIKSNHACKAEKKSKRTRAIQKLNKFGHRAILSGTFISKSPVNAFDQMEFLKENYFDENMFSFESTYCIMIYLQIGRGVKTLITEEIYNTIHKRLNKAYKEKGQAGLDSVMDSYTRFYRINERRLLWIMQHEKYTPFMNVSELYRRIEKDVMVVKKEDALDLPPKIYETIKVEPNKQMLELYTQLLKTGFTEDVAIGSGISMYHRFQDICNGYIPKLKNPEDPEEGFILERQKENVKIGALLDQLDDINVNERQIVVWSNRKLFLKDIHDALAEQGYPCCIYDGDTSAKDKEKIKEDFTSGKIRIFIGNQRSGSFGLDFLKTADYEFFMANDYSVETREQAEDRLHRGGITTAKNIYDIVVRGTIDEKVTSALKLGKELIHSGKTDKALFDIEEVIF